MNRRFAILIFSVLALAALGPTAWMAATGGNPPASEPLSLSSPSILVASLNMAMVTDTDLCSGELQTFRALRDADLLFLQEVVREEGISVAEKLAARLGRQVLFASPEEGTAPTKGGVAILSRTPLLEPRTRKLKSEHLVIRSRHRIALAATVQTPLGPVRAITVHLDTRINPGERLLQLQPALDDAQEYSVPAVIGGDLNTNDMQWVSNIVPVPFPGWQASRVRALMESKGFRTPFTTRRPTFDHLGMQLDWIFTNRLKAVASGIVPIRFSDHHAVWVQFTL